ncbi:MAG TPA: phosphoenolpyruvate--protein phosphotransferase [Candidatus Acidoferrales bacterium]|nr:phosphoenolpyruvate--protein phosphotransferase [Candidatus Acidoferrales bacterium]
MAVAQKPSSQKLVHLSLIEDINTLISHSHNLQETLKSIVTIVAEQMRTEVCSLYILDRQKKRLTLRATTGLDPEAVGKVSMGIDEGLTGLVIERMSPVMVVDAQAHPRYKYFPETGEERFHSFLGVPLVERKTPLGVLVVQTSRRRQFSRDEVSLLKAISSQVSNIVIQARLLESIQTKERERKEYQKRLGEALRRLRVYEARRRERPAGVQGQRWDGRLTGLAVAPGFGRGKVFILKPRLNLAAVKKTHARNPTRELEKFRAAVERGLEQISHQKQSMRSLLSKEEEAVFDVQRLILEDPDFIERVEKKILRERVTAAYAVCSVFQEYLGMFARIEDEYLRERADDVRDVAQRILENLSGTDNSKAVLPEDPVLVSDDLLPADLSLIEGGRFRGIVLAKGGVTSHAALLAKSFELPTVVGVEGLLESVRPGDSVIVDGNSGVVFVNPNPDIVQEYERLERDYRAFSRELDELRDLPSETLDGHRVALYANVGLLTDIAFAHLHGAQGIGLYRTEVPFLAHVDFPDEEEQYNLYCRVVDGMQGKPVTIRTLDIGADKYPLFVRKVTDEPNPFLGWRSIRISLEVVELFKTQLRAILRAGAAGRVRLLLPMISSLEELFRVKEILAQVKEELKSEGVPYDPYMELGIMIEVPSAVQLAGRFIREVDFFSIGTNDLIQYLLAVDRSNPKVADLYQPLHPAVLGALMQTIQSAKKEGKRVALCGEMAGDPLCTLLLLGMGLEEFSMEAFFIPIIKKIIRSVSYQDAKAAAQIVLQMDNVGEIKRYLFEQMRALGLVEMVELHH